MRGQTGQKVTLMTVPLRMLAVARSFAFFGLAFASALAQAQMSSLISESQLMRPWERHLAALKSMESTITGLEDGKTRSAVADVLFALEPDIGDYESQVGEVINRLAGDPQFSYVAGETSLTLSQRLDSIHEHFAKLYDTLGVAERDDVRAAQEALDELRGLLRKKRPFEVDVVNALGSGMRQIIVGLATRWWNGEQKAAELREYISALRKRLE